jgi:F-actin-capping protein subunit alpha
MSEPNAVNELGPAFQKYNEEQFVTVKLPGGSQPVIISSHSSLGDGRYYDVESSSSFAFDHTTQVRDSRAERVIESGTLYSQNFQKASAVQSHVLEGPQADLV